MEVVVHGYHPVIEGPVSVGIPWLLVGVLCITFVCGFCCGRVSGRPASTGSSEWSQVSLPLRDLEPALLAWDNLVRRALRFVARRRRIGLAFASYRDCTLRYTPPSRPTQARVARRRVASRGPPVGIPPLQEGPTITGHGSNRDRTGSN